MNVKTVICISNVIYSNCYNVIIVEIKRKGGIVYLWDLWDHRYIIKLSQGLHSQEKDLQSSVCGSAGWCLPSADTGVPQSLWRTSPRTAPHLRPCGFPSLPVLAILMYMDGMVQSAPAHLQIQTTASGSAGPVFPQHLSWAWKHWVTHIASRELKSETREHWARVKLLRGPSEGPLHLPQGPCAEAGRVGPEICKSNRHQIVPSEGRSPRGFYGSVATLKDRGCICLLAKLIIWSRFLWAFYKMEISGSSKLFGCDTDAREMQ